MAPMRHLITPPSLFKSGSRLGLTLALTWLLTGCTAAVPLVAEGVKEISQYVVSLNAAEPADDNLLARAITAVAEGRYLDAEAYLNAALSVDPYDDRALRQLAVVYRLTGRPAKAQSYEQMTRDIEMVDDGTWVISTVEATPTTSANTIQRFVTLNRLFDAEFITEDEYDERREANLGLLLPLTQPVSSINIELQPPRARDVFERIGTITLFKQHGALDLAAFELERNAILEGLMPLPKNQRRTIATITPEALDPEAHQRWLDRLLETELITPREYKKENDVLIGLYTPAAGTDEDSNSEISGPLSMNDRPMTVMDEEAMAREEAMLEHEATAILAAVQEADMDPGTLSDADEDAASNDPASLMATASVTRVNIHLALSRTPESAQRSWDELQNANGLALDGLIPRVSRVDLGGGKGIFFQLSAGPLADMASAELLCDELLSRDYYCAPLVF